MSVDDLSLRWKFALAIGLVLALLTAHVVGAYLIIQEHEAEERAIKVAGEQRALSERMTLLALQIAEGQEDKRSELRSAASRFDKSLEILSRGDSRQGISEPPTSVKNQLQSVQKVWEPYHHAVAILLASERSSAEFQTALDNIQSQNQELRSASDRAFQSYQNAYERKLIFSEQLIWAMIFVDLIILAGLGREVDRRIITNMEQLTADAERIADGDLEHDLASVSGEDEVGRAVTALQDMKRTLSESLTETKQTQNFLDTVVNSLSHPLYVLDAEDYTVQLANDEAVVEAGDTCYEVTHQVDKPCNEVVGAEWPCPLEEMPASESSMAVEHRHYQSEGAPRICQVHATPIIEDGQVTQIVESNIEITERVRYAERLEERTKQIAVLDRVLRHNLRNDMNVVLGFAERLRESMSGEPASHANKIIETGEKISQLSEKQREITSLLSEEPTMDFINLANVVENTADKADSRFEHATINISKPKELTVRTSTKIGQAIEELVENAVIHSDKDSPSVKISTFVGGTEAVIQIADDGPGIPKIERSVLKGDEKIESLYHGSGLGLWLVHLIVHRSQGTIEFRESDEWSSIVAIKLPTTENNKSSLMS